MPTPPTIRSLARMLGLSVATTSEALRHSPRVREKTRVKVQRAADEAGYRPNPLLGATLSALRRSPPRSRRWWACDTVGSKAHPLAPNSISIAAFSADGPTLRSPA